MNKFYNYLLQLNPGDRVVVPKSSINWVQHHAIYLGCDEYGRHLLIENKDGIGVRVVTAETFFIGVTKITRTQKFTPRPGYSRQDLVNYALSKRGRKYHLMTYNCEHFANEVQNRVVKSQQVNVGFGVVAGFALLLMGGAIASRIENK